MSETVTLLHPDEAAKRLRVSRTTIGRYLRSGRLDGVRVGPKLVKVDAASVDRLIADGQLTTRPQGA
jgi:excisionase family DNA binding protein